MPGRHGQLLGGDVHHAAVGEQGAEPALDGAPVGLHLALGLHLLAPEQLADRRRVGRRARSRASRRGCARGRSRGRPCAARRPRSGARWRRRRWSCRRRPCRCRGSSAGRMAVHRDRGARSGVLRYAGARLSIRLRRRTSTLNRIRTLFVALRARARDSGVDRRLRRRRRLQRGPADRPRRDLQQRRPTVTSGDLSPERLGRPPRASRAAASRPASAARSRATPTTEAAIPQLDWTVSASGRGRRPEHRLRGRARGHRRQRLRRVQRTRPTRSAPTRSPSFKRAVRGPGAAADRSTDGRARSRSSAASGDRAGRAATPSACDIDLESWLTNLTNEGTEDVGGTETIHIRGDADVEQILTDIGELASSIPGAAAQGFDPSQLSAGLGRGHRRVDRRLLGQPTTTCLRKLELSLAIDPSAIAPAGAVPIVEHRRRRSRSRSPASTRSRRSRLPPTRSRSASCSATSASIRARSAGPRRPAGRAPAAASGDATTCECMQQATTPDEINACASELQG